MGEFHGITPILNVKDFAASMDYYVNKLGFTKEWDWGTPPTFGAVANGQARIFFCQGGQGQPGTWLSIFVDDVDELFQQFKAKGVIIRQEPTNFPWGLREMNVEDPDGHRLRFGSESCGEPDKVPLKED